MHDVHVHTQAGKGSSSDESCASICCSASGLEISGEDDMDKDKDTVDGGSSRPDLFPRRIFLAGRSGQSIDVDVERARSSLQLPSTQHVYQLPGDSLQLPSAYSSPRQLP